jgi:ferredoxin
MIRGEWRPGVMHAAIFAGFLILLFRKLHLIAIGYDEAATYPGAAGLAFATIKDFVELGVLAACGYALYRRLVQKPRRLERNREAIVILSLIVAIMVTDFAFDAFRFARLAGADPAIAAERDFAIVGRALAALAAPLPPWIAAAGYHGFYWLALLLVFAFLVILPTGEHFHIVTALPALYVRRGRPANVVPYVDLERAMADDAGTMTVGARSARDLTWKEGLDAFTCTECGRCKDACPTFLTGKPLSLKWVNDSVKRHLVELRAPLSPTRPTRPCRRWSRRDRRGHALGVHHLRLLRSRVPDRARAPSQVLPAAPAPRDDGRRVPARAARRLLRVRGPEQSVGLPADTRGDWASRPACRSCATRAHGRARLPLLRRLGRIVRRARAEDRRRVRARHARGRREHRGAGGAGDVDGRVRAARRERDAVPAARGHAGRDAGRVRRAPDRHLRPSCLQHAAQRIPRVRRPLRRRPPHAAHRAADRGRPAEASPRARARALPRSLLPRRHNGEYDAPRAILRSLVRDAPLEFPLSREKAMCCGAAAAACGWRRRSASASTSRASSRRCRSRRASSPPRARTAT